MKSGTQSCQLSEEFRLTSADLVLAVEDFYQNVFKIWHSEILTRRYANSSESSQT